MRSTRLARVLAALLPPRARRDLFEPALCDLDAQRHGRRANAARLILLFLDCWRVAPAEILSMFLKDLRHAFRLLRRDALFTATVVLTLTLGVGANVAVFALVNAVLLRPLPYPDADRLAVVEHRSRQTGFTKPFIAIGDHIDLRARQTVFEAFAGYGHGPIVVHGDEDIWEGEALTATEELFTVLRAEPFAGRVFDAADMHPNAARVAMLGYEFWQRHFGGDLSVIGRAVPLGMGRLPHQVVGIAPPHFRFPPTTTSDVIVPLRLPPAAPAARTSGWTFVVGRLAEGVTPEQAGAQMAALSQQMEQEHPEQNQGSEYYVKPLRDALVGDTRPALLQMLGAVGVVLLIACVNVANLLAARSIGRRREMAVRVALGAGRRQILMQLVAESIALGVVSGIAALAFAYWTVPALVSQVPASLNLNANQSIAFDGTVLGFAALVSFGTALAFGLFSGLGLRRDIAAATLTSSRGTTSSTARRASSALVVAEIALAIVLLASAGLVLRSFASLLAIDPGFRADGVLTASVAASPQRYPDEASRAVFQRQVFDAIRALPGVEAVGSAAVTPLTGNTWSAPLDRVDRPSPQGQRPPEVGWQAATAGYFSALRIPLLEGRLFDDARDTPGSAPVVIVSAAVRDRHFDGASPIGKRVRVGDSEAEVVGVVGNIRRSTITDQPWADLYFPQSQSPSLSMGLFVRTASDPATLAGPLLAAIRGVDPQVLVRRVEPFERTVRESTQVTRLALWLLGVFAATALALAAVGIYGVMSYSVRQRTRELGTRVALGATPLNILGMVMTQGLRLTIAGAVIGLVGAAIAGRALASLLFDTQPAEPFVLVGAALVLALTAMAACYLPARRAARVDPDRTLTLPG